MAGSRTLLLPLGLGLLLLLVALSSLSSVPPAAGPLHRGSLPQEHRPGTARAAAAAAPPQRRLLQLQRLDAAGVRLEARPASTPGQLAAFRSCLNDYSKGPVGLRGGSGSRSTVLEAGAARPSGRLTVMLADAGGGAYKALQNLNAQTRGARLQPLAFAEPASASDVAGVVRCANAAGLRFAARNGGHSYEAMSLLDGGVVIDLRAMKEVEVDAAKGTAVLGGGQKLGSVYAALSRNGYTLPAGTCVGVGISGFTLGGGLGHATRALGIMADSVLAASVVLANGSVVTASKDSHPDLFWAIRGGGPLYGIVTSWTVKLHKAPQKASIVKYKFRRNCTEDKWAEVLTAWNAWKPWTLPKEVALADIECGFGHLWVQMWVWGSLDDAMRVARASPVYNLEEAYPFSVKELAWPDFVVRILTNLHDSNAWSWNDLAVSSIAQDQGSFVAGSLMPRAPMGPAAVSALAKLTADVQEHAFVQARAWGGAMDAVPADFNAFPWRGRLFEFQVYSASGTAKDRDWVDRVVSTMQPLLGAGAEGELYNYFHCVSDPWRVFFGQHAARLKAIKAAYDPDNRLGGLYCQRGVVVAQ